MMIAKKNINEQYFLWTEAILVVYFTCLFLAYFYKYYSVIFGVFQEMLTFPALIAQIILTVFSWILLIRRKYTNRKLMILATSLYTLVTLSLVVITIGTW